jgi:hypothetical protein
MKKVFTKFLMCLCISLISGYGSLYANGNTHEDTSLKDLEYQFSDFQECYHNLDATIKSADSFTFKQNDKTEIRDSEDDEEDSSSFKLAPAKKLSGLSNYFTNSLFSNTTGYFCDQVKTSMPLCKHIFNFPTQKLHIVFSVFRI